MKLYRIVLVGCGSVANAWIDCMAEREECEIVALVDIKLEFAQGLADRRGLTCPVYTDISQAIQENGSNIVFNVTNPDSHYTVCVTALQNGCHVLSEKPMAATMTEARDMIRLSEQAGKTFAVMQNRRYNPNIRAFRDLVSNGSIGRTGYIGADFFIGAHFGGFRDLMESPLIFDMAIHTFDQARFLTGADPISVYCHEFNPPGSWYAGNASAICIFEFSDGSVFCYRGSWCSEGAPTSWEAVWRVIGEHGTVLWDGTGAPYADIVPSGDHTGKFIRESIVQTTDLNWIGQEGHNGCLDEMFASIKEGRKAETDCSDNINSIAMVLGAMESAKTGRKIDLREYMQNG